jgi:DNA/RNA non-specific endonuclease
MVKSVEGQGLQMKVPGTARGVVQDSKAFTGGGAGPGQGQNRSHIIGDQFTGSGYKQSLNLMTCSAVYNQQVMLEQEMDIADYLGQFDGLNGEDFTFNMKVDVEWGKEVFPGIVDEVMKASPGYNDPTRKEKLTEYFQAANPRLKFCAKVTWTVTGQGVNKDTGQPMAVNKVNTCGPDVHWVDNG